MGIYNRSYMRESSESYSQRPWAVKSLLVAMLAVFILQNVVRHWFGSYVLEDTFALSIGNLTRGFVHTLITYGLLHSTERALPWHLVFNAFFIWWFGKTLEERYGSLKFLELFLISVLIGGVTWSLMQVLGNNSGILVGASAGAYGVLYLFCREHWNHSLSLFFLPIQFLGKHLFYVLVGFQAFFFLFSELPGNSHATTAYSAHLGGILGAYIYERFFESKGSFFARFKRKPKIQILPPSWDKKSKKASNASHYKVNVGKNENLKAEVDRILDKINESGFGALTEEEKDILDRAKDQL